MTECRVFPWKPDQLSTDLRIPPVDADEITRHELTWAVSLGDQQLPIEAVAHWYAQKMDGEVPEDEHNLLDFICRTGISGVRKLRSKWEGRSKAQIQWYIVRSTE